MLPQLSTFLGQTVTPERAVTFLKADNVLEEIGFETHRDELTTLISSDTSLDAEVVVDAVETVLRTAVNTALSDCGIELSDTFNLDVASSMLGAVLTLEDYEDSSTVLTLLSSSDTPESILAELFDLVGQFNANDYLENIERVSTSLIERIEAVHAVKDPVELPLPTRDHALARVKLLDLEGTYLKTWVDDGLPVGLPIEQYVMLFDKVEDHVSPEIAAKDVLAITLASSLPDDQLDQYAKRILESHFPEVDKLSLASSTYRQFKEKLHHA